LTPLTISSGVVNELLDIRTIFAGEIIPSSEALLNVFQRLLPMKPFDPEIKIVEFSNKFEIL
jgi:hypothetical protein